MVEPTVASGEGVTREGVAASTPRRTACARAALMGVAWSYDIMCYLWCLVLRDDSSAFLVYDRSVHDGCLYDGIALHVSVRVVKSVPREAGRCILYVFVYITNLFLTDPSIHLSIHTMGLCVMRSRTVETVAGV